MSQPEYKRWYDYDPLLMEVLNLLKHYQDDLKSQAAVFLDKIEAQVGKETIEAFYEMVKPPKRNRWYDQDPVLSKTIELLRIVPPDVQKRAAQQFLDALKAQGITPEALKSLD